MKKQNVMMKGTKSGLTLQMNDQCSYEELKLELKEKLANHDQLDHEGPALKVQIQLGNRLLSTSQEQELIDIVHDTQKLEVENVTSLVMTKEEAQNLIEAGEMSTLAGIVRSGQVIEVTGDFLLIGDVNPGGTIRAGGNIYVMGALKGIAHAGCYGDQSAVIAASLMVPSQLRIAEFVNRAPDQEDKEDVHTMECAYVDKEKHIVTERVQILKFIRQNLTTYKGGNLRG
jgi:septum site-determining protein MinC